MAQPSARPHPYPPCMQALQADTASLLPERPPPPAPDPTQPPAASACRRQLEGGLRWGQRVPTVWCSLHTHTHTCGFTPVTEQPMMRPCRRTPLYHLGPMRVICTSLNPARVNHCMYSSSVGNSIQQSAKNLRTAEWPGDGRRGRGGGGRVNEGEPYTRVLRAQAQLQVDGRSEAMNPTDSTSAHTINSNTSTHLDTGCVGCTGPMMQATPPGFVTLYASVMPRCGSGQYSMLPADT